MTDPASDPTSEPTTQPPTDPMSGWTPATWLIAAGRDRTAGRPLNVPPVLASNFYLPDERLYSRSDGTPTTDALEELLGGLDGGRALAFASGMAAAAVVFNRLAVGSRIAVPTDPYHGVAGIIDEGEAQGRWSVRRLDQADTSAWLDAVQTSDLVWLESPENPLMTVADLPEICGAPRPAGTIVAVDSTFATPLNQQPLHYGADVVMHSATKFIGGHSDLLAGVLITRRDDLHEEFHHRRLLHGASIGALEAFLTIRGARTMGLRVERGTTERDGVGDTARGASRDPAGAISGSREQSDSRGREAVHARLRRDPVLRDVRGGRPGQRRVPPGGVDQPRHQSRGCRIDDGTSSGDRWSGADSADADPVQRRL